MEKYYCVFILNAMTAALDIPSEYNATVAKFKLIECQKKIPARDARTKVTIDRYVNLIRCLVDALKRDNDEAYDRIRAAMYAIISEFAKHISDEINSVYF